MTEMEADEHLKGKPGLDKVESRRNSRPAQCLPSYTYTDSTTSQRLKMHVSTLQTAEMTASRTNLHPGEYVTKSPVYTKLKVFLKGQTTSINTEYRVYK